MRVLVLGGSGMLGSDVVEHLKTRGHEAQAPSPAELDITDPTSIAQITADDYKGTEWCINCAAYTAVDKAEEEEQEAAEANALGPAYLARVCSMVGIPLLHVSTDFVFDGKATEPYDEEAITNPIGVYAKTKLAGEEGVRANHFNHLIVRTAWLYGPNGKSFPKTIIDAWKAGKTLRVVDDQVGSPTYTADLARTLVDLIEKNPPSGTYHATGPEPMSWHAFAVRALKAYEELTGGPRAVEVTPIRTRDWPTPAQRPSYSVLSNEKLHSLGIKPMRPVDEALREFAERAFGERSRAD